MACCRPWWRRWSSRCAAATRPTRSSPPTSPGTLTCARCRTPTRCCSTGWCPTTSRRCCRSCTPRRSGWPASASARSTAVRAAFSSPIPTATGSGRSCVTGPGGRSTSSSSPTGSGFWAWVTRVSAAWASRSASCRCTRRWAASTLRAPCRCSWTWAPTTPGSWTTRCTSAGGTSVSPAPAMTTSSTGSSRRCGPNCPVCCCNGRTSPPRTRCRSWSATAISCSASTMTSRALLPSSWPRCPRGQRPPGRGCATRWW